MRITSKSNFVLNFIWYDLWGENIAHATEISLFVGTFLRFIQTLYNMKPSIAV